MPSCTGASKSPSLSSLSLSLSGAGSGPGLSSGCATLLPSRPLARPSALDEIVCRHVPAPPRGPAPAKRVGEVSAAPPACPLSPNLLSLDGLWTLPVCFCVAKKTQRCWHRGAECQGPEWVVGGHRLPLSEVMHLTNDQDSSSLSLLPPPLFYINPEFWTTATRQDKERAAWDRSMEGKVGARSQHGQ
ncbi:hypothetical protein E2320_013754, partial [Naja naja]